MTAALIDDRVLFALDEPETMIPVERAETASKARYLGWRILMDVGYVECPFDPRETTARKRWMARFTDDPSAELTHRFCEPDVPGAELYWHVVVAP